MTKGIHALLMIGAIVASSVSSSVGAASPDEQTFAYAQYGQWDSARQVSFGIETPWPIQFSGDRWTTFWQGELGEWFTKKNGRMYKDSTEIALGPVGRYYFDVDHSFYFDGVANIGFITPRYWRDSEQEGSAFDFGGGFAFGYRFGGDKSNEISLRAEHFSNGGLRDPNPGRNFFQIRYAKSF